MATNYPINPRVRALGKARIDIAQRAQSPQDWQKLWKRPANTFPFAWGERWKHCVEYRVDDFAAEVGFFIDILGLPVNAFDPDYAMFTSPEGEFFFAVTPAPPDASTPPDALRLQFMVADIFETADELENRGIAFEQPPQPVQPGAGLHIASFRTPHGICIDLWGEVKSLRPSLADIDEADDEDIFLPNTDHDAFNLFNPQDAEPLQTPANQPAIASEHDLEEDEVDEDDYDDEDEDDDDIEYVDIDSA